MWMWWIEFYQPFWTRRIRPHSRDDRIVSWRGCYIPEWIISLALIPVLYCLLWIVSRWEDNKCVPSLSRYIYWALFCFLLCFFFRSLYLQPNLILKAIWSFVWQADILTECRIRTLNKLKLGTMFSSEYQVLVILKNSLRRLASSSNLPEAEGSREWIFRCNLRLVSFSQQGAFGNSENKITEATFLEFKEPRHWYKTVHS